MVNNYHKFALDRIRNSQPVILLSGPSIKNLDGFVDKINNKNITFFSVNNKFIVEKNILSKIDQKVHVWQINCTIAIKKFSKEIIEFLSDDSSLLFLTTSEALNKIYDILDLNKDKINFSKIFLLDHIHHNLCKIINPQYTPCDWGEINALGFMLSFISLLETKKDIYLFGCDGLDNPNQKNVYYGQESILSKRVDRNLSNEIIYNEMMIFNNRWDELMKKFLTDRDIAIPTIYNVNPGSFYNSFEKMNYDLAFSNLSKTSTLECTTYNGSIEKDCYNIKSDLDRSIRLHNLNLSIQSLLPQRGKFDDASLFMLLNLVRKSIKSKIKALFGR